MDARSIIAKLRRQEVPTGDELMWFAQGLADGGVRDAQAGAFAMAVCMGGLGANGRADLTVAMRDSGEVLTWELDGPQFGASAAACRQAGRSSKAAVRA